MRIFEMTSQEVDEHIEKIAERVVKKYLPIIEKIMEVPETYVNVDAVCKKLEISRQTFYNWRKDLKLRKLLEPYVQKVGGKILCNLEGIKLAIKKKENVFGNGRGYNYKFEATATDDEKKVALFNKIRSKIFRGEEPTEEEKCFYKEMCFTRSELSLLKESL